MKNYYKSFGITCICAFILFISTKVYAGTGCTLAASITYASATTECASSKYGALAVTASGGTKPYTYSWSPSGGTADTAKNLAPGVYTVTVTDFAGCIVTAIGGINKDSIAVLLPCDTICGSTCIGNLCGTFIGGTGPFTFAWSTGQTTACISSVSAGTYTLNCTDANGCSGSASASIVCYSNIPGLSVTPTITNTTCASSYDGSIVLAATASTSPFRYNWENKYWTNGLYNIPASTYSVVISDTNHNCNVFSYTVGTTNPNCGIVYGSTFNDTNFTCTYSAKDPGINSSVITINPGGYTYTPNIYGSYSSTYLPYGTYSVTQTFPSGSAFAPCTSTQSVVISSSTPSTDFADTTHSKLSDPMIVYLYSDAPIIGEPFSANFQIKNIGTDTSYGRSFITIPDSMTFISATPAYTSYTNDTVYWNYSGLAPGDTLNYGLNCNVSSNPSLYNYISEVSAGVIPSNTESNSENNGMGYAWGFADAIDPNTKSVSPVGTGPAGNIQLTDSVLTYIVRFQNTGTAAAHNIYVVDTISNHLDINTLDVLGSSNTYSYQVTGNRVKFIFNNINLPDSGANQKGSHGWIQYRIKQNAANKAGDVIHNTGYIYFDYNAPVATNTTTNTIAAITGIGKIAGNNNISVYPNPSNGKFSVELKVNSEKLKVEIYNVLGEKIYSQYSLPNTQYQIDLSKEPSGIYFYRVTTGKGELIGNGKLIIQ